MLGVNGLSQDTGDTGDTVGVAPVAALTQPQHNIPTVGAGFIPALTPRDI